MKNNENRSKGSYILLPSYIIEDEHLEEGAKILYALISKYSNLGKCCVTNTSFAEKQKVTIRTIQLWLKKLIDRNYVNVEINTDGLQTIRNIFIVEV